MDLLFQKNAAISQYFQPINARRPQEALAWKADALSA
jgi:hypothetical protein